MIGGKRVIGLCLTKIQSTERVEYASRLNRECIKHGYKLMIFNSPVNFYVEESFNDGARAIYSVINYDIIDILVIYDKNFYDKSIVEELVSAAKVHDTPVILLKERREGCISILSDYRSAFKSLIKHVIQVHDATDTFFIAGKKENDRESAVRISYYKEALKECGLEFDQEKVAYGEYWGGPTKQIIRDMISEGKKLPQAFICANDYMAFAVVDELKEHGYRVPEDIIVTGFDGIPEADYFTPMITTCKEDFDGLASCTVVTVEHALADEKENRRNLAYYNFYYSHFTESCGCQENKIDLRRVALDQYRVIRSVAAHEEKIYDWLDRVMDIRDISQFMSVLPKWIIKDSCVCLNHDFIAQAMGDGAQKEMDLFSENLGIIPGEGSDYPAQVQKEGFALKDMVPDGEQWAEDDTLYILTSIAAGSEVYGYYIVKTSDILADAHEINRTIRCINAAFHSIVGYYQQRTMLIGLRNAELKDYVTGLLNLKGVTEWFERFQSVPANQKKSIVVCAYAIPKYKYIYENYGMKEVEESVCIVAEALKTANAGHCIIGRMAENEFIVIRYFDQSDQVKDTLEVSERKFYDFLRSYNSRNQKGYSLEVSHGATDACTEWTGTLSELYKLAGNEMYVNRLKHHVEHAFHHTKLPEEYYQSISLLLEKNYFDYHFQPIVETATGEIYGYEALMRPDKMIGMNPMQVIEAAAEYDLLYEIEKATMFNVMRILSERLGEFYGRKIFINSLPGFFLKEEDKKRFVEMYSDLMEYVVIEITEESSLTDEELDQIKHIISPYGSAPIAIDDYGTGHSNIVNLLRYSPQVIKIDRYLITEVQKDANKQMFIRSTVEFAGQNQIKVLAEGVETAEELEMVVSLGVDLIQGFYTGRPAPDPLYEIPEEIKWELMQQKRTV